MQLGGQQIEVHMPTRLVQTVVGLLRGNAADRLRRMHEEPEQLLGRPMGVLDLVVHGWFMLTGAETLITPVGVALAAAAGFSQLFSP